MGAATCVAGKDARREISYPSNTATRRLKAADAASTIRRFPLFAIVELRSLTRSNGRVDLRRTPDLVDVQRAGLVAGHTRRSLGHTRQRDPDDFRLLGE